MTKKETRHRDNYLRREKFKKIKAENGEAYRKHLKTNRERGTRRRKRLKEDPATHQRELARGRRDRKQYRDRIRKNKKAYRQHKTNRAIEQRTRRQKLKAEDGEGYQRFLEKRKKRERVLYQQQRDELHDDYIKTLLMQQGFKKNKITKEQISEKRKQLLLKRALKPQKRQIVLKQKELVTARVKGKKTQKEFLKENRLKICCRCKQPKSFEDFSPCRLENSTYPSICRPCEAIINKQKKQKKKQALQIF